MTGTTYEQAAQALVDYFGTIPRAKGGVYDTWKVRGPTGKEWKLVNDTSITGEQWTEAEYPENDIKDFRVELVIPKLTYPELPKPQECVRRLKQVGTKVNDSYGTHVHIGAANRNRWSPKDLISTVYSEEGLLFRTLQVSEVRVIRFCRKVREPMLRKARALSAKETPDLTRLERVWYRGDVHKTDRYNQAHYYAFNLRSVFYRGMAGWRYFNSALNPNLATAYVNLCLAMSTQAITQHNTIMHKARSDNELFTFRVWLVCLGLNDDEFKETRNLLLACLDEDRAWRLDKDSHEVNRNKKKRYCEAGR